MLMQITFLLLSACGSIYCIVLHTYTHTHWPGDRQTHTHTHTIRAVCLSYSNTQSPRMSHTRDSTRLFESLRPHTMHCNTMQISATLCNTLQRSATLCNSLQLSAPQCNTLQHTWSTRTLPVAYFLAENGQREGGGGERGGGSDGGCPSLSWQQSISLSPPHTRPQIDRRHLGKKPTHCNTLQHTATHCNTHADPR